MSNSTRTINHKGEIPRELLVGLREGDHEAFSELYLHYWDSLSNFLTVLIGSAEEAKEMAQDIFVMLWDQREKINPDKNIKAYIFTIARNSAFRYFEHKKVFDKYASAQKFQLDDSESPSDELVIAKELKLLADIAVARMPKLRRQVFILSRDEGFSIEEISVKLGISREAVSSHLYQARKTLKEVMTVFLMILFLS